ncbi:polysaccharide biosynthesis/export family protein [Stenotrophobium rhamnosiphilum]|uniref:Polysaccharide biosynthesis/export family protein n=2 Tax=Stenotrophobium rhamnosiphilum TaxID=2029166 RepID=A0A2T5ML33_9GAMM|nr:polysaccharide biosynthesis/export family protein [Stenotrophobium rhamnosiphilum]
MALLGLLGCSVAIAAPLPGQSTVATTAEYRLGVGDVVRVEVRDESDLTIEAQVQADGAIKYPFLGSVVARGKSVSRLQQDISLGLRAGYLVNPDVRVRVVAYRPVYVTGQVVRPGGYPYIVGLTVEKVATIAGGFTDRASLRNIYIVREGQTQNQKRKVSLDTQILPGDTIIVEESIF